MVAMENVDKIQISTNKQRIHNQLEQSIVNYLSSVIRDFLKFQPILKGLGCIQTRIKDSRAEGLKLVLTSYLAIASWTAPSETIFVEAQQNVECRQLE
jgi:hypothetical protein